MKLASSSALDLKLKGSVGSFKVGAKNGKESFEVKYLLTHVGLNFEEGTDEKLLRELAPVREIFDFKSLDFDELMQRDIDDARVSSELIPYILDDSTSSLVKFFPPIVVVALPIQNEATKPSDYYPEVVEKIESRENDEYGVVDWWVTQAGEVGKEVFKFEQPIHNNEKQLHDLVFFKINTSKCKLVIVDGQHRAMALLALYRNLKSNWSDAKRKPFESYYQEWTPDYIKSFNLKEIKLPMIICTIPGLDEKYQRVDGDFDLKKASRSIFLTLNKNARKVSRSRNLLLDDSDLVSSFMRRVLSKIKNGDRDFIAPNSLEIHNVELDQAGDRQVINSPMAFTGVSHIYYIIEHLLLDSGDVSGVKKREGRFSARVTGEYFTNALTRLDCENLLGKSAYKSITRNVFSRKDEHVLSEKFIERYGQYLLRTFSELGIYKAFSLATQTIKSRTAKHADIHIKPMLFDGQGISRVFEEHKNSLEHRLKEGYFKHDVPKIEAFKEELDATFNNYLLEINNFYEELTKQYLDLLSNNLYINKNNGNEHVYDDAVELVKKLYKNVFTTIAFQAAIVCGFYSEFEKYSNLFNGDLELDLLKEFEVYITQLNEFFLPKSFHRFKVLSSVLIGETSGTGFNDIKVLEGAGATFRSIVHPGEMSPDEWPKYRYLILEIWNPESQELNERIESERVLCRHQVLKSLYERTLRAYIKEHAVSVENVQKEKKEELFKQCLMNYKNLLKNLGKSSVLEESKLKASIL